MFSLISGFFGKIFDAFDFKKFFKFIIDRYLSPFIDRQITIQDFKNGPLHLRDIPFKLDSLNKNVLHSSPYILHSGRIGQIRIVLPQFSSIIQKSIEIEIKKLQISIKPNKNYTSNITEMFKVQANVKKYIQEKKKNQLNKQITLNQQQTGIFQDMIRKIIGNIKINVSQIIVNLHMNQPDPQRKIPNFYIMARINNIRVNPASSQELRYKDSISQKLSIGLISVYILRQDQRNLSIYGQKGDIWQLPRLCYPQAICKIGNQKCPLTVIKQSGQFNKSIKVRVPNIEVIIDPIQMKIIKRFTVQLQSFSLIKNKINRYIQKNIPQSTSFQKEKIMLENQQFLINQQIQNCIKKQLIKQGSSKKQIKQIPVKKNVSTVEGNIQLIYIVLIKQEKSWTQEIYRKVWLKYAQGLFQRYNNFILASHFVLNIRNIGLKGVDTQFDFSLQTFEIFSSNFIFQGQEEDSLFKSMTPQSNLCQLQQDQCPLKYPQHAQIFYHNCIRYITLIGEPSLANTTNSLYKIYINQQFNCNDRFAIKGGIKISQVIQSKSQIQINVSCVSVQLSNQYLFDIIKMVCPVQQYQKACKQISQIYIELNSQSEIKQHKIMDMSQYQRINQSKNISDFHQARVKQNNNIELKIQISMVRTWIKVFKQQKKIGQYCDNISPDSTLQIVIQKIGIIINENLNLQILNIHFSLNQQTKIFTINNKIAVQLRSDSVQSNVQISINSIQFNINQKKIIAILSFAQSLVVMAFSLNKLFQSLKKDIERINKVYKIPKKMQKGKQMLLKLLIESVEISFLGYSLHILEIKIEKSKQLIISIVNLGLVKQDMQFSQFKDKRKSQYVSFLHKQKILAYKFLLYKYGQEKVLELAIQTIKRPDFNGLVYKNINLNLNNIVLRAADFSFQKKDQVENLMKIIKPYIQKISKMLPPPQQKQYLKIDVNLKRLGLDISPIRRGAKTIQLSDQKIMLFVKDIMVEFSDFQIKNQKFLESKKIRIVLKKFNLSLQMNGKFPVLIQNTNDFMKIIRINQIQANIILSNQSDRFINVIMQKIDVNLCYTTIAFLSNLQKLISQSINVSKVKLKQQKAVEEEGQMQFETMCFQSRFEQKFQKLSQRNIKFNFCLIFAIMQMNVSLFDDSFFRNQEFQIKTFYQSQQINEYIRRNQNYQNSIKIVYKGSRINFMTTKDNQLRIQAKTDQFKIHHQERKSKETFLIFDHKEIIYQIFFQKFKDQNGKQVILLEINLDNIYVNFNHKVNKFITEMMKQISNHKFNNIDIIEEEMQNLQIQKGKQIELYLKLKQFTLSLTLEFSLDLKIKVKLPLLRDQIIKFQPLKLVGIQLPRQKKYMINLVKDWALKSILSKLSSIIGNTLYNLLEFIFDKITKPFRKLLGFI